jgi:hypothetical protein
MSLATDIVKEWGSMARETADGLGRALTTRPRWSQTPPERVNLWPRTGDTRTYAGEKQIYHHGWVAPTREESRVSSSSVPSPDYAKAQRAARQARAAGPRIGRKPR